MKSACLLLMLAMTCAASAAHTSFDRYESIIERQVFGTPPEGFDPTNPGKSMKMTREDEKQQAAQEKFVQQEEKKLQSAVRFSVINLTPAGETVVGFTDRSDPKGPKHYYMKVGEEKDGWLVKEADPAKATMTIVKHFEGNDEIGEQDITVTLSIGGDSSQQKKDDKGTKNGKSTAARTGLTGHDIASTGGQSRRERRAKKQAELAAQEESFRKMREDNEATRRALEAERAEMEERSKADKEEQRKQLQAIAEELKKARETRKGADEGGSADVAPEEK